MNAVLSARNDLDEMMVNRARRRGAVLKNFRWFMLVYGLCFLAVAVYGTVRAITKIELMDDGQLTRGFVYGLGLGIAWSTFGLLGGLCLGKFIAGCRYHDRLRELEELSP